MKIELKHPAWKNLKLIFPELLDRVSEYNTFNSRTVRLSNLIRLGQKPYISRKGKTELDDLANEFLGDVFECFAEYFLLVFGPTVNVYDFEVTAVHDWGVDGKGRTRDGKIIVVQIKFRSDATKSLRGKQDKLDGFVEDGYWTYQAEHFLIFTNANGVRRNDYSRRWKGLVWWISPNSSFGLDSGKKFSARDTNESISIRQLLGPTGTGTHLFWEQLRTTISLTNNLTNQLP
jgi:hypothetical protein